MKWIVKALLLLALPACISENNYVHKMDQQEAQMRAAYQEAKANAAMEANLMAMASLMNNMVQQNMAARNRGGAWNTNLPYHLTQPGNGTGLDLNIIVDFVNACESGDTLEAAALLGRATSQFADDPELKSTIDQMACLLEMQAKGGQAVTTERPVSAGGFEVSKKRETSRVSEDLSRVKK